MSLKLNYEYFPNGDFGDISRIEVERGNKAGYIDFFSSGTVNIHLVNMETGEDLINVLLFPEQKENVNQYLLATLAELT